MGRKRRENIFACIYINMFGRLAKTDYHWLSPRKQREMMSWRQDREIEFLLYTFLYTLDSEL